MVTGSALRGDLGATLGKVAVTRPAPPPAATQAASKTTITIAKSKPGKLQIKNADPGRGHKVTEAETGKELPKMSSFRSIIEVPAGLYNVTFGPTVWKSVEVKAGTAADNREFFAGGNLVECLPKLLHELMKIKLLAGINDVNKMVRNLFAVYMVLLKVLSGANVEPPVNLSRIGADDLATQRICQMAGEPCFAARGGTQYNYAIIFFQGV